MTCYQCARLAPKDFGLELCQLSFWRACKGTTTRCKTASSRPRQRLAAKFLKCGSKSARAVLGTSSMEFSNDSRHAWSQFVRWFLSIFHLLKIATDFEGSFSESAPHRSKTVDVASQGEATSAAADCHANRGTLNERSSNGDGVELIAREFDPLGCGLVQLSF